LALPFISAEWFFVLFNQKTSAVVAVPNVVLLIWKK
jgi:hypothetical protein